MLLSLIEIRASFCMQQFNYMNRNWEAILLLLCVILLAIYKKRPRAYQSVPCPASWRPMSQRLRLLWCCLPFHQWCRMRNGFQTINYCSAVSMYISFSIAALGCASDHKAHDKNFLSGLWQPAIVTGSPKECDTPGCTDGFWGPRSRY